jgi:hypothetical protein
MKIGKENHFMNIIKKNNILTLIGKLILPLNLNILVKVIS